MFKSILLEIIDFIRYKILADECTPAEMAHMAKVVSENIDTKATMGDIARHYGQSQSNVRNIIARRYVGKPTRRVYYNVAESAKVAPKTWHQHLQDTTP